MTETEIKSMIDKDLYESILNAFTWEKVREQKNYYYTDKAGILREKRIMVRIRVVGEVAKIQVKLHKNENSPLQICEENEFETEEVPDIINAELAKEITGEDVGELYKMGCAVTALCITDRNCALIKRHISIKRIMKLKSNMKKKSVRIYL